MVERIKKYVAQCPICEKTKVTTNVRMPMQISSMGESLFDHDFIDFVGPIPKSARGNKYIFTMICDLTKFLQATPTEDCTALTAANCLLEHVICRYNFPSRIISDNATSFTSNVIKQLTNLFSIKKIFCSPFFAQSNIVERSHRTLNGYLRAFTNKEKDNWDEILKFATFAYNNTVNASTGQIPHYLAHGFKIQIPNQLTNKKLSYNYDNLADNTRNNIADALKLAREHVLAQKLKNKKYYDRNTNEEEINIGDMVLLKTQVKNHKFQDIYEGPYEVVESSESNVTILKKNKPYKTHKNHVKKSKADHNEHIEDE